MIRRASRHHHPTIGAWRLALGIVFLAALAVRLYGLDWDDGADLHPDELFIAKIVLIDRIHFSWPPDLERLLDPARSGLNPRSVDPATGQFREFAYGALPLWVTDAGAFILSRLTGVDWNGIDHAYLVGRFISALLSALTVVPIAVLGRAVGGVAVGLLAALFATLAPMSIQLAHFFTTDSWLTFFVACSLLACTWAARCGGAWRFAVAGIAVGLAMASKGSVFTLAIPVVLAVVIDVARARLAAPGAWPLRATTNLLAAGAGSAAAFFAFEPYALLRPDVYFQSLRTQADIVSGSFDVPFTRVYAGTPPVLYQLEQFVRWGYGPVAGLLAILGLGMLGAVALRRQSIGALILLSWGIAYSAVLVVADVKFLRYLEPLAPVFAVSAALALIWISGALKERWPVLSRAVAPAALLLAVVWTGAFVSIYAHENPRVSATKWIYGAIPPGANLTAEYWDDSLPRALTYAFSPAAFGYGTIMLDLYRDLPPADASDAIYEAIDRADYIVQSSQRVEAAMFAAPWRYPVQGRFFELLRRGSLGFSPGATFERHPAVGDLTIDDSAADESFINYDHPRVAIYERTATLARSVYDNLMEWALQRPWYPSRTLAEPTLLLDHPVGENPSVNDARWSAPVTASLLGAAAIWFILLLVLAAVGLPFARLAFPTFPDAGWGLTRTVGLLVAAYPVWLGASLHLVRFRAAWVLVSLLAVALLGRVILARIAPPTARDKDVPVHRRPWLHAEAAFWLVFAIFLAFRLVTPDGWHPLWGGEKPMEFSLINAISRGAYFPPYDPWYADGYVNYYYYGFYLMAFLFKATGIPAEIAFNLALPTLMGLLASSGFSVGLALTRGLTRSRPLALVGGWLAVLAICLIGNLTSLRTLVAGIPPSFDPFIVWVWNGSRAIDNAITEFPFFTGLYADLHAHVVALPLTVLAIALSLSIASSRFPEVNRTGVTGTTPPLNVIATIVLLALTLGALTATNAWDVPVYAALAIASVLMGTATIRPLPIRAMALILGSAAVAGGAWLLYLPFHRHYVALFSQLALVRDPTDLLQFLSHLGGLVAICSIGLTALLLPRSRHGLLSLAWPAIALLLALLGLLGLLAMARFERGPAALVATLALCGALIGPPLVATWARATSAFSGERMIGNLYRLAIVAVVAAGVACVIVGRPVLGVALAFGGAAGLGWLLLGRVSERFVCLLLAAASFIVAGTEVVVVADDLIGTPAYRMNTVFKFYNQVWILLAIGAAALLALMLRNALAWRRSTDPEPGIVPVRVGWSRLGVVVAAIILVASLTYPLLAIGPRLAQRFEPGTESGTLDARGWMAQGTVPVIGSAAAHEIGYRGDAGAIRWLLENVEGTPVIAEASIGPYRCNGTRITAATGLPTIIGWERHEQQQRYPETLPARVADVRTLYTTPDVDEKLAILFRYNVEYVIVGDLERLYPIANNECTPTGSQAGIEAFDRMVGKSLEVAHAEAGTTIYRVLGPGTGA